ncbi:hypothetical protein Skr01_37210 [Sphaerisporangium krabiense]|uniref:Uncharacterized protein n=1 Tax=Sphaerisporangium krabiense TaxID=763782 RepID=A0A7W8Z3J1_9ACTN|nr:hypothetical protein [Sphaerisporangium krabiense]MBB5626717.1 hypothetical protein [Sphaerisporangium krabiense]GII63636.1 hypothetical protein Skr01_37210 [Sphaerisporangium krabiense]
MRSTLTGAAAGLALAFTATASPTAAQATTARPAAAQAAIARPAAASAAKAKVVYGWAVRSGDSALSMTPRKARRTELGESGQLAWELGGKTGAKLKIRYTGRLDFRQVNKKCGKPPAGYPYDTSDKQALGTKKCLPSHLLTRLKQGALPVRVEYNAAPSGRLVAVKVQELVLP